MRNIEQMHKFLDRLGNCDVTTAVQKEVWKFMEKHGVHYNIIAKEGTLSARFLAAEDEKDKALGKWTNEMLAIIEELENPR